jgi:hypothetical protein
MVRWINLALAVVLATLLVIELTRSRQPGPPVSTISAGPPVVAQERPGRRSRRMEARMAIEEAQRLQRERLRAPSTGRVELDDRGFPIKD